MSRDASQNCCFRYSPHSLFASRETRRSPTAAARWAAVGRANNKEQQQRIQPTRSYSACSRSPPGGPSFKISPFSTRWKLIIIGHTSKVLSLPDTSINCTRPTTFDDYV